MEKIVRPLDYWLKGTFGDTTGFILALPEDKDEKTYSLVGLTAVAPEKGPTLFSSYREAEKELHEREQAYRQLTGKRVTIRGVIMELRDGKIVSASTEEGMTKSGLILRICGVAIIVAIIVVRLLHIA